MSSNNSNDDSGFSGLLGHIIGQLTGNEPWQFWTIGIVMAIAAFIVLLIFGNITEMNPQSTRAQRVRKVTVPLGVIGAILVLINYRDIPPGLFDLF